MCLSVLLVCWLSLSVLLNGQLSLPVLAEHWLPPSVLQRARLALLVLLSCWPSLVLFNISVVQLLPLPDNCCLKDDSLPVLLQGWSSLPVLAYIYIVKGCHLPPSPEQLPYAHHKCWGT